METAKIEKRVGVQASTERLWDILSDLPGWNRWNPVETGLEGAIAFGGRISLTETIPGLTQRPTTVRIADWQPYAQLIWAEKRGWAFDVVRYFEIEELVPGSCIVANGFIFSGLRGELFHDRHRKTLRAACEAVAEGLRREALTAP
ncbi:SRPBCC domain-containing protein [uncultured Brevundimonas sp.]|uniref:SRPBCC domain-containing protein n=1 Tax=uncultured Brevundimonas sp. TaxID=213418 RepID=UPI0030EB2CC5|tara:strand:- start:229 stop:666 length:438 start_codon:yes stop_codon:yes gene_type:complete